MIAPVDVLAVLRALERMPSLVINLDGEQIPRTATTNVISAVAELIEADKEYDDSAEAARGFIDDGYETDSYGVHGSDFYRCLACDAESGAGVLNKGVTHDPDCVRYRYELAIQRRRAALARVHPMTPAQQAEQAGVRG